MENEIKESRENNKIVADHIAQRIKNEFKLNEDDPKFAEKLVEQCDVNI